MNKFRTTGCSIRVSPSSSCSPPWSAATLLNPKPLFGQTSKREDSFKTVSTVLLATIVVLHCWLFAVNSVESINQNRVDQCINRPERVLYPMLPCLLSYNHEFMTEIHYLWTMTVQLHSNVQRQFSTWVLIGEFS